MYGKNIQGFAQKQAESRVWLGVYMPEIYKRAGFKILVMDADSFLLSFKNTESNRLKFDVKRAQQ